MRRALVVLALVLGAAATLAHADQSPGTRLVEVVEVEGIVDAAVARSITTAVREAERGRAEALIVQVDTEGGIEATRAESVVKALLGSRVPVVTWVGPPGATARNSGAALAIAGHVTAMAPGTLLGPAKTLDLRARRDDSSAAAALLAKTAAARGRDESTARDLSEAALSAEGAEQAGLADVLAIRLPDLLKAINGKTVQIDGTERTLRTDPGELSVRFRKRDILGRVQHAVTKPSMAYLLVLLGFLGIVFEVFHPSTGPAGFSGLLSLGLGLYGVASMRGSWLAVGLLTGSMIALSIDLRYVSLGLFTLAGFASLVAGSLLLFTAPRLRVSPWVLAFGVSGMTAFMLGAMTRVLRDLRAVASGEREIVDLHEIIHHAQQEGGDA